jgi:hypothetical protein
MRTRCEADGLSTGALADTSTDVLTKQGFLLGDRWNVRYWQYATNSQASMAMWPYGMEYQVVAESALVGWKSFFVESSWWPLPRIETEKHSISTGTYGTPPFDGGGVTVWGCFSLNCKLDLYFLEGTLTRQMYRGQILRPLVVTHFDSSISKSTNYNGWQC